MKLKNCNCDKTQIVMKLETKIAMKLKNYYCEETRKLTLR